jgi:hypothetical protein
MPTPPAPVVAQIRSSSPAWNASTVAVRSRMDWPPMT